MLYYLFEWLQYFIPCFDGGDPRVTYFKYLGR